MEPHSHGAALLSSDDIRQSAEREFQTARSHLAERRKQTILKNLSKVASYGAPPFAPGDLRNDAVLALKSLSRIASCSTSMGRMDRAPNGLAWVRVSTNLKAPDNYKDKFFIPYLGESDAQQNFSNEVAADATITLPEHHAEDDISDIEDICDVSRAEGPFSSPEPQLRTGNKRSHQNGVSQTILWRERETKGKKSSETVWDRAARRVALHQIMRNLNLKQIRLAVDLLAQALGMGSSEEIESCYRNVRYRQQAYQNVDDEAQLRITQKEELLKQLRGAARVRAAEALQGDSIPFFFCRQCYIYNCLEHGTQTAKPARTPRDRTKKETASKQGVEDIESRCPDRDLCQCWCYSQSTEDVAKWWLLLETDPERKDNLKAVVLELFTSFGKDPCRISELARIIAADDVDNSLTCRHIGYMLDVLEETNLEQKCSNPAPRRARKKYRTKAPRGETESMKGGQRVDYAPCQHDGPCTAKNCRCVENGVNCEKYCSCNHNRMHSTRPEKRLPCQHAFQGCTCRSAVACMSNACVCYSYGRECDPDLCQACCDCRDKNKRTGCRNVGLLMGERQRTVVGHSETHGWGAFAANDIIKGDIIGEYVGEVISHLEADRRGRLYDEIDYSFLFNITENWALDSTRLGNKLRYCNHHFKPNCIAKLMRVGGDVRVGLYAIRDIGKHEELFFDYKYKNGPAWSMPGSTVKKGASYGKQESAKKRAPAFEANDFDEEVIPVPKKRARLGSREPARVHRLRDVANHRDISGSDGPNLVSERLKPLNDIEHISAISRSGRAEDFNMGQNLFSHHAPLSIADDVGSRKQRREEVSCAGDAYGDKKSVPTNEPRPIRRVHDEDRSGSKANVHEIRDSQDISRKSRPNAASASQRQAKPTDDLPDSRANNVTAVITL